MTFNEWVSDHDQKLWAVLEKLKDYSAEEIVDYFDFENMKEQEPDFCPLYEMNTKCHNVEKLNCLFCACPFFDYSDNEPLGISEDKKVMSHCNINSRFSSTYEFENNVQCDCSNCTIPHTDQFAKSYIKTLVKKEVDYTVNDSVSLLEMIRGYQLADILGKYKLF